MGERDSELYVCMCVCVCVGGGGPGFRHVEDPGQPSVVELWRPTLPYPRIPQNMPSLPSPKSGPGMCVCVRERESVSVCVSVCVCVCVCVYVCVPYIYHQPCNAKDTYRYNLSFYSSPNEIKLSVRRVYFNKRDGELFLERLYDFR